MAFTVRTINEIFTELLAEKINLTSLDSLTTSIVDEATLISALDNGQGPDWVLILYNMAVQTHLTEVATESAITDIQTIFDNEVIATAAWYINEAKKFQFSDPVILDPITYQPSYDPIVPANQIIGSVTIKTFSNKLFLKVRRVSTDILSVAEKTAFEGYMNQIKIAGTQLIVENFTPDLFTLTMTIIYDGSFDVSTITASVEAAIADYLDNIQFDSKFVTNALIDKLQLLDGVIDPQMDSSSALDALAVDILFEHEYTANAGYGNINPATPLSSTITYVPR